MLEFIASLFRSLAWPASAAVIVFVLRAPIRGLIQRVSKVRGAGFEVEMGQAVETGVRRGLAADAVVRAEVIAAEGDVPTFMLTPPSEGVREDAAPHEVIAETFDNVQLALRAVLESVNASQGASATMAQLVRVTLATGLISQQTALGLRGLETLAALARPDRATAADAEEFVRLSDGAVFALGYEQAKRQNPKLFEEPAAAEHGGVPKARVVGEPEPTA